MKQSLKKKTREQAAAKPVAGMAFLEVQEPWQKDFLTQSFPGAKLFFSPKTAEESREALRHFDILSVFISSRLDRAFLKACPGLKLITTRSTGFDHIDLEACGERGIAVANVPVYGENTVAEHTFALILSLSRNLRKAYLRTVRNDFSLEGLMGFDLKGRTLGVIGTGHIGLHVIRMAVGFGMKVVACDAREQKFLSEVLNFEYRPFEEVLKGSDILTLHVPLMPSTRHMINENNIRLIKKGAVLINTARGGLVETGALVKALDEGILSGAGLDVLEDEEFFLEEKRLLGGAEGRDHWQRLKTALKNHVLLQRENVVYTPHMAFYSREAAERILATTVGNIRSFLAGKLQNQVLPSLPKR